MKQIKKRLVSIGLALAVALPMGGSVFAESIIVEWNPNASGSTSTTGGGTSGGTSGVTLPVSTATDWKMGQTSMSLKVGQTSTVSLVDSAGNVLQSSPSANSSPFANAFIFNNGQLVSSPLENAPVGGNDATSGMIWTSSDESVATVQNGVVTAKGLGRAVITATAADGTTSSCIAHVALKGIDVSTFQKTIDWSQVKAQGIDFAMIRTGYGWENWATQKDAYFEANYAGATANGIKVGAYHYSYATTPEEARQEAQMALSILGGRKLDYPLAFDMEDKCQANLTPAQAAEVVKAFCDTVEAAGYKTAIYSYSNFYNSKLTDPSLDKYDKWVAHWGTPNPSYTGTFTMWQFGTIPLPGAVGGNSNVDVNYCYYDYGNSLNEGSGSVMVAASAK